MEYTILILVLPFLSFLILALAGMKMSHRLAGIIGTISLALVALVSYFTPSAIFLQAETKQVFIRR